MLYEPNLIQVEGSDFVENEVLAYVVKEDLGNSILFTLPKSVFNDIFHSAENPIQRMKLELLQLSQRINELQDFLNSDDFNELTDNSKKLLNRQLDAMRLYQNCLQQRYDNIRLNPTFGNEKR